MQAFQRMLRMVGNRVPRFLSLVLLMALPFGYYPDYPDSSQFEIGFGGGYGQVASIARDCSGGITQKAENTFTDFSVAGFGRTRLSERTDAVYGGQLGYFRATARFADIYAPYFSGHVERWYFGPRMAIEGKYLGIGLGFVVNHVPYNFEYDSDWDGKRIGPSFHLRFGSLRGIYLMGSLDENSPLIAGGGHLDVGIGFPVGGSVRAFSGVSALPYDQLGYLQQIDISLSRKMALNLALRAGEAGDIFEGAAAATLVFRLGSLKWKESESSQGF